MADPEIDVKRLRLNPGDVIVVKVEGHLSPAACRYIEEYVKIAAPDNKCIVVEAGCEIFTMGSDAEIEVPEP